MTINPVKFFAMQLLVVSGWVLTLGAVAFVLVHEGDMLTVIQGWGWEDPIVFEV